MSMDGVRTKTTVGMPKSVNTYFPNSTEGMWILSSCSAASIMLVVMPMSAKEFSELSMACLQARPPISTRWSRASVVVVERGKRWYWKYDLEVV